MHTIPTDALNGLLAPITVRKRFRTWAHSFGCTPLAVFEPESVYQCQLVLELARRNNRTVRVVGVGHSPSDVACTHEYMMSTLKMNRLVSVNCEKKTVVVEGGMIVRTLNAHLAAHDLAMSVLGSISDQTIGGVITTATHGSGAYFPVISDMVLYLTLLLADGSTIKCSRAVEEELFLATLCGFGSTGLVVEVCLQVENAFCLRDDSETLDFDTGARCLDTIVHSAEHVKFWWYPQSDSVRVSRSNRAPVVPSRIHNLIFHVLIGFHFVQFLLFIARYFVDFNTSVARFVHWLGSAPSTKIDRSWRIFNIDLLFSQYTTEWAIPYDETRACLHELNEWLQRELADPAGLRPHFPVEIRFSAADDIFLSPSHGRKTTWIGIIQYKPYGLPVRYRKFFAEFARIVGRHRGRPHWAKEHTLGPDEFKELYPKFLDFQRVLGSVDPCGVWRGPYVRRHIFGDKSEDVEPDIFKARRA
ncbi:L-gulonolactone/D-arabinono-1,4-lactone oxidase [Exidia glandulosa HHB12029]|uniref:D-arabinono-1,4-lactone oxidase n=1 Tax=Exidia glandulosa HHB12029 TaxID=1314781 RepID=A0A165G833_EXIGL|nr:L-gulonolactone/D-arabinono-1,4-lactone oxidase [Exidia glandulosa HHB12029]